ncbi:MAG TPA: MBL fold metallo-hydrolase [Candidatus Aerophobetes bacterium]|nr:MBL fold metallo-hydrolase [Candidatus Aerophobetes bacterium]
MQLKVICDNRLHDERLEVCWGFSCLVGKDLLFDTGENEKVLLGNMEKMNISPKDISTVVISHDHYDHTGGLGGLLRENSKVKIYGLSSFSSSFKEKVEGFGAKLIEEDKFTQIMPNIYLSGELSTYYGGGRLSEHSLIIKTESGLIIITGCSHPGIIKIIEEVKKNLSESIYLVMGGFHLMDKDERVVEMIVKRFRELGVKKAGPTHCTGEEAIEIFKKEYKKNFLEVGAGKILEVV